MIARPNQRELDLAKRIMHHPEPAVALILAAYRAELLAGPLGILYRAGFAALRVPLLVQIRDALDKARMGTHPRVRDVSDEEIDGLA